MWRTELSSPFIATILNNFEHKVFFFIRDAGANRGFLLREWRMFEMTMRHKIRPTSNLHSNKIHVHFFFILHFTFFFYLLMFSFVESCTQNQFICIANKCVFSENYLWPKRESDARSLWIRDYVNIIYYLFFFLFFFIDTLMSASLDVRWGFKYFYERFNYFVSRTENSP